MIAPGIGPFGGGIALVVVGYVFAEQGKNWASAFCVLAGLVLIWSAFRARQD